MVLSKTVKLTVTKFMKGFLKLKGYNNLEIGNVIEIPIEDAPQTSKNINVLVKCECCNKEFTRNLKSIDASRKKGIGDLCEECNKKSVAKKMVKRKISTNTKIKLHNTNIKFTINDMKEIFKKHDAVLLNNEYINSYQDLFFICNKHKDKEIQITKYNYMHYTKHICKYCRGNNTGVKHTPDMLIKKFNDKNLKLLNSNEYINSKSKIKLKFKCNKHPKEIQEVTMTEFNTRKYSCKHCKIENEQKNKEEKRMMYQNKVVNIMKEKDMICMGEYTTNRTPINFICKHHPNITQSIAPNKLFSGHGCKLCGIEKNKGENHYNYQGGISNLNNHLRGLIRPLVNDYLRKYNYKCIITGINTQLEIHHLYNFNKIVKDILLKLNLEVKDDISKYTTEELKSIEDLFYEYHSEEWGVPILPEIHDLFHSLYGNLNNSKEQFEEFKIRYRLGEFNKLNEKIIDKYN